MKDKDKTKEQFSEWTEMLLPDVEITKSENKCKPAEEALPASENFYRNLFENTATAVVILDEDNTILLANGACEKLTGYTRQEVEGKRKWMEFIVQKDDLERMKEYQGLRRIDPLSAPQTYEFQFVDWEGQVKDIVVNVRTMPSRKQTLATLLDVTDRKRAEAAVTESERRLADIINFLPDATFAIDLSGKVIAWNRAMEEMTGVKTGDMLGKGNYEYTIPFYGIRRPILIDLALRFTEESEKKYDFVERQRDVLLAETDVIMKEVPRALWGKAVPLYDSHGNVAGAIESIRDITELRQAREALQKAHDELEIRIRERTAELVQANKALEAEISQRKRAEEKILILANLSDISPLSIAVYDLQDNLLYANQKTFDMHGYSKEEFLARNLHEIDVPSSAASIEERKKEVLETGEARFNVEHYRKDGTCFPLEVFLKETKWREQTVLLSVASDVTERRRVEEELRKYREELEALVSERTSELESKTNNLQEVNTALNVLLQKKEEDKKIMEDRFVANIGSLVLPYVEKIRKYNLDAQQQLCLDTIEKNLSEIVSPLSKTIQQFELTPREIQIASLIKVGKTTKEIAKTLGIGKGSIDTHRISIRKKLGLDRTSNLQSHLCSLEQ
jgi:PAS domain S-box-containing protein